MIIINKIEDNNLKEIILIMNNLKILILINKTEILIEIIKEIKSENLEEIITNIN